MTELIISNFIAILVALIASQGFWNFMQKRKDTKEGKQGWKKLLLALALDKIVYLGMSYIHRGYMTQEEHATLLSIYEPYVEEGGNGEAKKVVTECDKLPLCKSVRFEGSDNGDKQ